MTKKLAINGGKPVRSPKNYFPAYRPIGSAEAKAASKVIMSGKLSGFIGAWCPQFYGGKEVQAFEKEWAKKFKVKHAVSMNSATSGLIAALGAIGIGPGDEVIVSPYSMCISATVPLYFGAIPVFADIEPEYFCLDPKSVEKLVTPRTKAIIPVDLLGQSHDVDAIKAIAKKHNLKVIVDSAQVPGGLYKGKHAGTLSDIGVYSFNFHKHIHTGEGTMVVTNDDNLAERLQLIRNHAESVVEDKGVTDLTNMIGYNFRMLEYTAAIGREQLKKLDRLIKERQKNCEYLSKNLTGMPGIKAAPVRKNATSVYYQHAVLFEEDVVGVKREKFVAALCKELPATKMQEDEGTLLWGGYTKPIYLNAVFQKQIAIGKDGFPFKSPHTTRVPSYKKGICPVVEELYERRIITHDNMRPGMTKRDLDDVIAAFKKVYENRAELT